MRIPNKIPTTPWIPIKIIKVGMTVVIGMEGFTRISRVGPNNNGIVKKRTDCTSPKAIINVNKDLYSHR